MFPAVVGVAVSKRSSRSISMGNLAGRRSCQGHMYSPSGWLLPVRHTLSLEHNSTSCDPNTGIAHTRWNDIVLHYWPFVFSLIYFSVVFVFTQFMSRCFGRAASLVLRGICVRFVWEAPATLQPNAVLTTTMSVTMATWELWGIFFYIFVGIMTKRFCIFMISFLDKNVRETPWVIQIFVVCFNPL